MRRAYSLLFACLLAGCGGGGGASAVPAPGASPQVKQGTLSVRIVIPSAAAAKNARTAALKRIYSAASATNGILFTIYPDGGNPTTQAVAVSGNDISATSSTCTTSGTTRTCTITIAAPAVSTNDLLAQTYDQIIPTNGAVPANAHILAAATVVNVPIVAGTTNAVSLTLNPVLSSVALVPTPQALRAMFAGSANVAIYGYDAAGNLIVSGSYVDQYGNPATVGLGLTTNPNNAANLTITTATGSGAFTTLTYNGTADTAGTIQIESIAPYPAITSVALLAPSVIAVPDANLTTPTGYQGIAYYNGGNQYYVFYSTPKTSGVSYIKAGGNFGAGSQIPATQTPNPLPTTLPVTGGLSFASGFLYTGGATNTTQFGYTSSSPPPLNPQVAATCTPNATGACGTTSGMAYDGKRNLVYYGANNMLINYSPGSSASQTSGFSVSSGTAQFGGVAIDAAGNVWFADNQSGGSLYEYCVTCPTVYAGALAVGTPFDVAVDGNSHAWVTIPGGKIVASYSDPRNAPLVSLATQGTPEYVTVLGDNSAAWISETTAAGVMLGRIDLTTLRFSEMNIASLTGGTAGPITAVQYSGGGGYAYVLAVVHYTATGGEVLLVQP